jgi:hypothetical protein
MTNRTHSAAGFLLAVGCAATVLATDVQPTAYPPDTVRAIKVQTDKAPDCSSLKSIADSVTRGCSNNDARAVAILNFMLFNFYHQPYAVENGGIPAIKVINDYGWGVCGGTHSVQSALWQQLGWDWRFVGWPGHTTVEANYDGRWHYLDAFYKYYAWMPDGKGGQTIASERDLLENKKQLIDEAMIHDVGRKCGYLAADPPVRADGTVNWQAREMLDCDDYDLETGKNGGFKWNVPRQLSRMGPAESWAGYNHADGNYSMDVNLAPGFALENTWEAMPDAWYWNGKPGGCKCPGHSCGGHKDTRNNPGYGLVIEPYTKDRCWGNGILTFHADLFGDAAIKSFVASENVKVAGKALVPVDAAKPAFVVVQLASPYILTEAGGEAAGAEKIEVSVDDGKTFKPAELKDFGAMVKGLLAAQVKVYVKDALKALNIRAIVQNDPFALPFLSPGKNMVSVSVRDPAALGPNKLVVTYACQLGFRTKTYEEIIKMGKRVANQSFAEWSDKTTCVQKVFTAKELPATFEIDCPTPKGRTPVYPRMVFIRREVISPSGVPLPLPDNAVAAKPLGPDEELATLPNPFLVGVTPPALPAKP